MAAEGFRLSSSDAGFSRRVDGLFSCLDGIASSVGKDGLVFEPSQSFASVKSRLSYDFDASSMSKSSGETGMKSLKDGDFLRPSQANIPQKSLKRNRNGDPRPNYVKDPNKWTCYSMKDTEELDDSQNKSAALQLLADLKSRDNASVSAVQDEPMEEDTKIVFRKPSRKVVEETSVKESTSDEVWASSANFGGSKKFMMPEYVVGAKEVCRKKLKANATVSRRKADKVQLSHLNFDDDEGE